MFSRYSSAEEDSIQYSAVTYDLILKHVFKSFRIDIHHIEIYPVIIASAYAT